MATFCTYYPSFLKIFPPMNSRALISNNFYSYPASHLSFSSSLQFCRDISSTFFAPHMLMQVKPHPAVFPVTTSKTPKYIISTLHLYSESVPSFEHLMGLFTYLATSTLNLPPLPSRKEFQIQPPLNQLLL